MNTNGKTLFAFFAVAMMLLSAGIVLCSDQSAATENAQQEITTQISISKNATSGNIECTIPLDKSGKKLVGVDWKNGTLELNGANIKYTGTEGYAIMINKGLGKLSIKINNSNTIECKSTSGNDLNYCIGIDSGTEVNISGTDREKDSLTLNAVDDNRACVGINCRGTLNTNCMTLKIYVESNERNANGTNLVVNSVMNIKNTHVIATASSNNYDATALTCTTITENSLVEATSNSKTNASNGIILHLSVENSTVVATSLEGGQLSVGIHIGYGYKSGTSSISKSTIIATGGQTPNNQSNGIRIKQNVNSFSIIDSVVDINGKDMAITDHTHVVTPGDINNCFDDSLIVRGWINETEPYDVISGEKFSTEYKHITSNPLRTITYDLNGGSGSKVTDTVEQPSIYTVRDLEPTMKGFRLVGWSDGTNVYQPGDEITIGWENITLKAVWEIVPAPPADPSYDYLIPSMVILLLFVFLIIIGLVMRRRDDEEE